MTPEAMEAKLRDWVQSTANIVDASGVEHITLHFPYLPREAVIEVLEVLATLRARLEAAEKALRRAEQTIRNAALGFAEGDARTILLNEASNCAAALAGEE